MEATLVGEALAPTYGWEGRWGMLATSATYLLASVSDSSCSWDTQSIPSLSFRLAITESRLALPHLSPYPFIVPWTWTAPAWTAANVPATAVSASLWVWMPRETGISPLTRVTMSEMWLGRVPPLVSHSTTHSAPASAAALTVARA